MNARGLRHKTGNLRNMRCSEKECHEVAGVGTWVQGRRSECERNRRGYEEGSGEYVGVM